MTEEPCAPGPSDALASDTRLPGSPEILPPSSRWDLARNVAWNLSGGAWGILLALFSTPYVVHRLGPSQYGVYALLGVILAYLSFMELGLGRAVERHSAAALGAGEAGHSLAYFETALWLQCGLGATVALVVAAAGPYALELFKIAPEHRQEATTALSIAAVSFGINLILGTAQAPIRARERFSLLNKLAIFSQTLTTALVVGAATWQPRLVWVVGALCVASAVRLLLALGVSLHLLGGRLRLRLSRQHLGDLLRFGGSLTLSSLVTPVLAHVEKLLIGVLVGAGALTYYIVPFRVLGQLGLVSGALSRALFPHLSRLQGEGHKAHMWRSVTRSSGVLFWLLLPVFATLWIAGDRLLALWMGEEFAAEARGVLPFLTLGSFINLLAWSTVALIQAHGRPGLIAKLYLAEATVYVPLAWLLMHRYGIAGAAAAWSARMVLDAGALWLIARSLFRDVRSSRLHMPWVPLVSAAGLIVAILLLRHQIPGDLPLLAVAGTISLIVAWLGWRTALSPAERQALGKLAFSSLRGGAA